MNHSERPWAGLLVAAALLTATTAASQTSTDPAAPAAAPSEAKDLGRVVEERIGGDQEAKASQERINQLDDETQRLLSEYRRALAEKESYESYAIQLTGQIESQKEEMISIQQQLDEVDTTSRSIAPLVQKMLDTLK